MNLKIAIEPLTLHFKRPSGTSRGILLKKNSWIITIWDQNNAEVKGKGECSIIESLSPDWNENYVFNLNYLTAHFSELQNIDHPWFEDKPSIKFGVETALLDLKNGGKQILFPSLFTNGEEGIKINGLIWMGDKDFMFQQIKEKIEAGFTCIKMKIGAIDFEAEIDLLRYIRTHFSQSDIELRVDANGAFSYSSALEKLKTLSDYKLHSIEQPIRQGNIEHMARLCETTPLDIALDEELIGVHGTERISLLDAIKPQYIILKPSLVGGLKESNDWINKSEERGIRWWITSALESNIGLNAIAQWTYTLNNKMPQGLGTGQLYTNNTKSPLQIEKGFLYHRI